MIPAHTAYHAVHRRGQVQAGETVAVLGAAAASAPRSSSCAWPRARRARGRRRRREGRVLRAAGRGGRRPPAGDVVPAIRGLTGGRGVDVIVDPVQGEDGAQLRGAARSRDGTCCAGTRAGWCRTTRTSTCATTRSSARPSAATRATRWSASTRDARRARRAARRRYVPPARHPHGRVRRGARRRHRPRRPPHQGPRRRAHLNGSVTFRWCNRQPVRVVSRKEVPMLGRQLSPAYVKQCGPTSTSWSRRTRSSPPPPRATPRWQVRAVVLRPPRARGSRVLRAPPTPGSRARTATRATRCG